MSFYLTLHILSLRITDFISNFFSGETLHLYYFSLFADSLVSFISYWFTFFNVVVFTLFFIFLIFIYLILIYFVLMCWFIYVVLFVYLFLLSNDFIFHLVFQSILYALKLLVSYLSEVVHYACLSVWLA